MVVARGNIFERVIINYDAISSMPKCEPIAKVTWVIANTFSQLNFVKGKPFLRVLLENINYSLMPHFTFSTHELEWNFYK